MAHLSIGIQLSQPLGFLAVTSSQPTMVRLDLLKLCTLLFDLGFQLLLVLVEVAHDLAQVLVRFCHAEQSARAKGMKLGL